MGVCLSKKKKKQQHPAPDAVATTPRDHLAPAPHRSRSPPHPAAVAVSKTVTITTTVEEKVAPDQDTSTTTTTDSAPTQKPKAQHQRKLSATDEPAASGSSRERKPVFLVTPAKQRRPSRPPSPDPQSTADRERSQPDATESQTQQQLSQSTVGPHPAAQGSADGHLARRRDGGLLPDDPAAARVVRTSNCTKEEVESILIQCGRLSRSESGRTGETARRYSGVKRSYDFDKDAGGEEITAAAAAGVQSSTSARPSPRRRAQSRERDGGGEGGSVKRSNSRERTTGGSGSRRASPSPGRRSDNRLQQAGTGSGFSTASNSSGNNNSAGSAQPGKMVSVPAREKEVGAAAPSSRRAGTNPVNIRNSSPRRSRSPATMRHVSSSNENSAPAAYHAQHPQTISKSSSRKGPTEHSPYRRNPMAEIDDNVLRGAADQANGNPVQKVARTPRKPAASSHSQQQTYLSGHKTHSDLNPAASAAKQHHAPASKAADEDQIRREAEEALAAAAAASATSRGPTLTRTRSSRRSSRDLDALPLNTDAAASNNNNNNATGGSYASALLEDIQTYHQTQNQSQLQQQAAAAGVTLPACVSKACSILEAVAGLNHSPAGSWTESNNKENHSYVNRRGAAVGLSTTRAKNGGGGFVESEVEGRDDLTEPSMHRYVSVRDKLLDMEPQESAGSNTFIAANTWAAGTGSSSGCGGGWGDSVESERCWTSEQSGDAGDEVDGCRVEDRDAPPTANNQRQQPATAAASIRKQQRAGASLLSNGGGSATQASGERKREQQQHHQVMLDQHQPSRHAGVSSSGGIGRFGRATTSSVIVVPSTTS